jgi:hypothetical protein
MQVYGAEGRRVQEILENEDPTRRLQDTGVVQRAERRNLANPDLDYRVPGSDDFDFGHAKVRSTNAGANKSDPTLEPVTRSARLHILVRVF